MSLDTGYQDIFDFASQSSVPLDCAPYHSRLVVGLSTPNFLALPPCILLSAQGWKDSRQGFSHIHTFTKKLDTLLSIL